MKFCEVLIGQCIAMHLLEGLAYFLCHSGFYQSRNETEIGIWARWAYCAIVGSGLKDEMCLVLIVFKVDWGAKLVKMEG